SPVLGAGRVPPRGLGGAAAPGMGRPAAAMGSAGLMAGLGTGLRKLQTGYVRSYGLTTAIGVVVIGVVVILGRMA
ncbi:MAG: hypothetical protein L0K25_09560, partial [Acidipropionibacterium jensenii]|nr:hypothetical protein [Acidipropionibacterium jensenii]